MSSLDNILANPKFAGADELSTTVRQLKNDIAQWQNAGGVIDAWALDSIRKNSVNAAVRQLSADPKQQKQLAAKVMSEVKPLLIGAVEEAGGTGYGKYLSDYAAGMQKIGQAKLGAKALDFTKPHLTSLLTWLKVIPLKLWKNYLAQVATILPKR